MENRYNKQMDDVIDLKELMRFILKKWRILLLVGVVGIVLGVIVGMLKQQPEETFSVESLNMEAIHRYARYEQLYEHQAEREAASVYMNMDPDAVHIREMVTFVSASECDLNRVCEAYRMILIGSQVYERLAEESGLGCTARDIEELVAIQAERYDEGEKMVLADGEVGNAKVIVTVKAPTEEACGSMMELIAQYVKNVENELSENLQSFEAEVIADSYRVGYDDGVARALDESTKSLTAYANTAATLKKSLTADELAYYEAGFEIPQPVETGADLEWIKWSVIVGILFGGMAVVWYGVMYLMNGCVKTVEELTLKYGLQHVALLEVKKANKMCIVDSVLDGKREYNTDDYLQTSIDMMGFKSIQLSGDMSNAAIAEKMKKFVKESKVIACNRFAVDEQAQRIAGETDGVMLFVQLWNTKHAELLRELEICHRIGQKVLGVVVLD